MDEPRRAALAYALRGMRVLPLYEPKRDGTCSCGDTACRSPGKHPRTGQGVRDASSDSAVVGKWWDNSSNANVGLALDDGYVVLDVDPRNGGSVTLDMLEGEHGRLPLGPRVRTGDGEHIYFQYPQGVRLPGRLGPGVDVKAAGGYVVAPPSLHANGRRYEWRDGDLPIPDLPTWILDRCVPPDGPTVPPLPDSNIDIEQLRSAIDAIDPDPRDDWLKVGAALHHDLGEAGRAVWDDWSQRSAKFDADDQDRTWRSFSTGHPRPAHVASIFGMAKTAGWCPTPANESTPKAGGGQPSQSNAPWDQPLPLPGAKQPTKLPISSFDAMTRDYIEALSEHLQVPTDAVIGMLLAVLATSVQGRFRVRLAARGWEEPLCLFICAFMEPGSRKSAILSILSAGLHRWIREELARLGPQLRKTQAQRKLLEDRLKAAERQAANSKALKAMQEVLRIKEELAGLERVVLPDFLVDDATPEAVGTVLADQLGRCAVMAAEGDIIANLAGRYGDDEPRHQVFLKAHAGDDVSVRRVNRAAINVPAPVLTLGLCVQPAILHQLGQKRVLRATGLLARILFVLPEDRVGWRDCNPATIDGGLREWFDQVVMRLLDLPSVTSTDGKSYEPTIIDLDDDAAAKMIGFSEKIEVRMRPDGDLGELRDWASKLAGAVMRISGILCLWEAQKPVTEMTESVTGEDSVHSVTASWRVGGELMARAIALGQAFAEHAKVAMGVMRADPQVEGALSILKLIQSERWTKFSKRDAHRRRQKTFPKSEDLDAPLKLLVDFGYIRSLDRDKKPGPGQPSSQEYVVNPALLAE